MSDPRVALEIVGRDKSLGKVLEASKKQLTGLRGAAAKTQQQLRLMSERSGLLSLDKGFEGARRSSFGLFQAVSRIVDPLGIITGAGTLAGLAALEAKFASMGQSTVNSALGLNMSVDQLTKWQFVAKRAGVSADEMTSNIGSLEKAVADMRYSNSPANGIANQLLGPGWQKKYKSDTDLLVALSGRISGLHGDAKAKALEQAGSAFGLDQNVVSMLARGPAWLQKSMTLAGQHGAMTGGQATALDNLKQSLTDVGESIEGVGNSLASAFAPNLTKAAGELSAWLDKNRGTIVADVKGFVTAVGVELNKVPWKDLLTTGKAFFDSFGQFANMRAAPDGALALLLGAKILGIAAPFVALSKVLGTLSGAGVGSFSALGRALSAIGFAVIGGQIVQVAANQLGAGKTVSDILGDGATGAILGGRFGALFGPWGAAIGAAAGGAAGAGYGAYRDEAAFKKTATTASDYLQSHGFSRKNASAILGNLQIESGLDPTAHNNVAGGHYGIAQWDTTRQADFAALFHHPIQGSSLGEQLQFLVYELTQGKYKGVGDALKKTDDLAAGTNLVTDRYEVPALPGDPRLLDEERNRRLQATRIDSLTAPDPPQAPLPAPGTVDNRGHHLVGTQDAGAGQTRGVLGESTSSDQTRGVFGEDTGSELGNEGPHIVEIHVSTDANSKATVRQRSGQGVVKTVTAMPTSGS